MEAIHPVFPTDVDMANVRGVLDQSEFLCNFSCSAFSFHLELNTGGRREQETLTLGVCKDLFLSEICLLFLSFH